MAPAADPGVLLFPYYDMMNDTLGHMAPCETGILVEYSLVLATWRFIRNIVWCNTSHKVDPLPLTNKEELSLS